MVFLPHSLRAEHDGDSSILFHLITVLVELAREQLNMIPPIQKNVQFQVLASGRRRSRRKALIESITERLGLFIEEKNTEHPLLIEARGNLGKAAENNHPEALHMLGELLFVLLITNDRPVPTDRIGTSLQPRTIMRDWWWQTAIARHTTALG